MAVLRLCLCLLLLLSTAGCMDFLDDEISCGDDPTDLEGAARFTLPPDYSDFAARCTQWIDNSTTQVRFTMPAEHLAQFQASTQITEWQTETTTEQIERFDLLNSRQFQAIQSYLYGATSEQLFANGTQQVLIDTSDPQRYTVYIFYFVSY